MAKRTLSKSKIGYTDPEDPRPLYGWHPGGFGCSGGCEGCWSRALAKRFSKCEQCRAFAVHLHEERLCEPANTKRAGVVLKDFTNDWLDHRRTLRQARQGLAAMRAAEQHCYVTLTQQADRLFEFADSLGLRTMPNVWNGITIRNPHDVYDRLERHAYHLRGLNAWLSAEPLQSSIELLSVLPISGALGITGRGAPWGPEYTRAARRADHRAGIVKGVIVGHDNRRGAPGTETLDHVRSVVEQCRAAGVNCYVKQIWLRVCKACGTSWDWIDGPSRYCPTCGGHARKAKLLRASHPDEFALYPDDLKLRETPWRIRKESDHV